MDVQAGRYNGPRGVHFGFRFRCGDSFTPSPFTGSAWRGAFGNALQDLVCPLPTPRCEQCPDTKTCVYHHCFNTPVPHGQGKMRLYTRAPAPFVLNIAEPSRRQLHKGDPIDVGITLFGSTAAHAPIIAHALQEAASHVVLGNDNRPTKLETESSPEATLTQTPEELLPPPPPSPDAVTITLHTPSQFMVDKRPIRPGQFRFAILFGSALRRQSLISHFHDGREIQADFKALMDTARRVTIEHRKLTAFREHSHSERTKSRYPLHGLTGQFDCRIGDHPELWPWLWWGQAVHVGKLPGKGLGRYSIKIKNFSKPAGDTSEGHDPCHEPILVRSHE